MSGTALVLYENAKRAIAQLREVDEVAEHLDKALAVEEYARRAKDRSLEIQAAEYRTYCESRLGEFSAAAKRDRPGRPENCPDLGNTSRSGVARQSGLSRQHLERTSEPLAALSDEQRDEAIATLKADGVPPTPRRVIDMAGPLMSSGSDEWYTPEHVWRAALDSMRLNSFDLDPCADPAKAVAAFKHYTETDDGLTKPWHGVVWMNPPYSAIGEWVEYLHQECVSGRCEDFAALVPARIDTAWWRCLTQGVTCTAVFVAGRLKFGGASNSAPFPSALVFGCTDPDDIQRACVELGRAWRPM